MINEQDINYQKLVNALISCYDSTIDYMEHERIVLSLSIDEARIYLGLVGIMSLPEIKVHITTESSRLKVSSD